MGALTLGNVFRRLRVVKKELTMNQPTNSTNATGLSKPALPQELMELNLAVSELPAELRAKIEAATHRVVESTQRRKRILNLVQEALSQLRLDMKYLMFDLEATRRERDELQRYFDGESDGEAE